MVASAGPLGTEMAVELLVGGAATALHDPNRRAPVPHGGDVRFLWLLPIYESERDFIYSEGLEALEARFDAAGFGVADLQRPPVA